MVAVADAAHQEFRSLEGFQQSRKRHALRLRGSQPCDSRCGDCAVVREIAARPPPADRVPIKGGYAWRADEMAAGDRLNARVPEAQIWMVRVGSRSLHRFGGREKRPPS